MYVAIPGVVVGVGDDEVGDVVVGGFVDEAIGAQHEPVATHDGQHLGIDAHGGLDAQGPRDDVSTRVVAGLGLGDVAGADQLLHVAVVDGDPAQAAVAHEVGAAVAHVHHGEHGVAAVERGARPPGDLDALAQAIVALSNLAGDSSIIEAEINPLIVTLPVLVTRY